MELTKKHKPEYLEILKLGRQVCSKCGEEKLLEEFYFEKSIEKHNKRCKSCRLKYNQANAAVIKSKARAWRNKPERKERKKVLAKESYWRNRELHMFNQARRNRRNLEFNLDRSDVIIPAMCPIFKRSFDRDRFAPSLDRIDNTKGYIKGNVRVISKLANTMKNSATFEELQIFCENVLKELKEDIVQPT